jgi:hypothetical protein
VVICVVGTGVHSEALEWNWSQRNAAVMLTSGYGVLTLVTFRQTSSIKKPFGSNSKVCIRLIVLRFLQRWILVRFRPVHYTEDDIFAPDNCTLETILCPWNQRRWRLLNRRWLSSKSWDQVESTARVIYCCQYLYPNTNLMNPYNWTKLTFVAAIQ